MYFIAKNAEMSKLSEALGESERLRDELAHEQSVLARMIQSSQETETVLRNELNTVMILTYHPTSLSMQLNKAYELHIQ